MKTALVTGAGKGIGYAVAKYLLTAGYKTVVVSRTEKDLISLAEFGDSLAFVCDISNADERERLADFCNKNHITPDVLVNNAGAYLPDNVFSKDSQLQQNLEMNLIQARDLTAHFWESMKSNGSGYVFNIISVLGNSIRLDAASYTMAKHALAAYNKLLFAEGRKHNIKVTGIFPSSVYTSSWDGSGVDPKQLISPEDIAEIIKSCLSLSAAAVPEEIYLQCMTEGF